MEPNNIENQIKEKLDAREIQPSAQAWDRLDAMLAVSEANKTKKNFGWFFVAASLLLFFGLGYISFNENETPKINYSSTSVITINDEIESKENNKINEISVVKAPTVLIPSQEKFSATSNTNLAKNIVLEKEENVTKQNALPLINHSSAVELLAEIPVEPKEVSAENKKQAKFKIKIDVSDLLSTVEKELDVNYKATTLDKLTRKIQDAKTALVNRNYE